MSRLKRIALFFFSLSLSVSELLPFDKFFVFFFHTILMCALTR